MNATELVIDLVNKINSLKIDLDCANYKNGKLSDEINLLKRDIETLEDVIESLEAEIESLEAENKTLKLKIDDMSKEF